MSGVPRWRIAAGIAVLAGLALFAIRFAPSYLHNMELQQYVSSLALGSAGQSDDALRAQVLAKARSLGLPVTADDVHVVHSQQATRIDVRYEVTVTMPGYTVNLHFYPGAGSR